MKKYYDLVFKEAYKALKKGEVPVGAIIVKNNKIIAKAHNNRQKNNNVMGHAEINCILKAEKKVRDWRLDECDLYVSLEPCSMCDAIIKESRIKNVFYVISRENNEKKHNFYNKKQTNVRNNDFLGLMNVFFENLRNNNLK